MKNIILVFAILLSSSGQLFSQKVTLTSSSHSLNLSKNTFIFEDTLSSLSFQEIQQKKFVPYTNDELIFPFSNHTFWLKVLIENKTPLQKDWVFFWRNAMTENVFFYIPQTNGSFKEIKEGCLVYKPQNKFIDNNINVPFSTFDNKVHTFYIKIQSQRAHQVALEIYTKTDFEVANLSSLKRSMFINGVLVLRGAYLLLLAIFVIKDKTFRQYTLLTIFRSLGFWSFLGITGAIFTSNPILEMRINYQFYYIMPFWFAITLSSFLEIHRFPHYIRIILKIIPVLCLFFCVNILFSHQWYWLKAATILLLFNQLLVVSLYLYSGIKKYKVEWAYSIPLLMGICSNIHYPARLLGASDFPGSTIVAYTLFVLETFFFGLFLGKIIRTYEKNKIKVASELIFKQQQAAKLQALDTIKTNFFANISHELRTPLTLIMAPIQDLLKENPDKKLYQTINRNANRLLELINQLLDLTKLEAGEMTLNKEETNLSNYFRTLTSSFNSLAESKGIIFEFSQSHDNILGEIDKDKVEKMITNLLSNAFKFTEKGKKVSAFIDYSLKNKKVTIQIKDEGIGISKDKKEQIFNRFYQIDGSLNRKYDGTGIGLALVKELLGLLNGNISVDSKEGFGTSFTLTFPCALHSSTIANTDEISLPFDLTRLPTKDIIHESPIDDLDNILLIVDDNADIRDYIKTVFEKEFNIIEAVNGIDGLAKATTSLPNLIVSDLMMPEMDGFEFCKTLKSDEKTSHIPIIMLTARANVESRIESFELGADDYLIKPFNTTEIKARVKNLLDKQATLRQYFNNNTFELKRNEIKVNSIDALFLKKVKEVLGKNLSVNNFGVEPFSQAMNMSSSQLLRKLKALTDMTVNEFIRDFRLKRAEELLIKKAGTVSEIAFEAGFESLSYFSKTFQEKFGKLPSEYIS